MVKDTWVSSDMSQYWNKKCVKLSFTSRFSKKPTVFSLLFCAKGDISWGPNFKRVELFYLPYGIWHSNNTYCMSMQHASMSYNTFDTVGRWISHTLLILVFF